MANKILIVEDNPANMELFSDLLAAEGHTILKAINGREGLDAAKSNLPDLILLDPGLPDIKGVALIREFKKALGERDTPLILCSASVLDEEKEEMLTAGGNGFIGKPIDTREFPKTIAKFL